MRRSNVIQVVLLRWPSCSLTLAFGLLLLFGLALKTGHACAALDKESRADLEGPLADLREAGRLKLRTWLEPAEAIVATQQVRLHIEIATDTWFTGGTRIGYFEVEDARGRRAIVLRRNAFATNFTRREEGTTWAVQQWTLDVYPRQAGTYKISPIPVTLSVAGEDNQSVTGVLMTPALTFAAGVPPALVEQAQWVATPRFEIEETFSRDLNDLQPGDAVQRTLIFTGMDLAGMMLPEIAPEVLEGVAVYRKAPQIGNVTNRGTSIGTRKETLTYVIERPGRYVLPARTFWWWDVATQMARQVTLPEHILIAAPATQTVATVPSETSNLQGWIVTRWHWLMEGLVMIGLIIAGADRWRRRRNRGTAAVPGNNERAAGVSESALRRAFATACRQGDALRASALLYQWLDRYGDPRYRGVVRDWLAGAQEAELRRLCEQVMMRSYGPGGSEHIDLARFASHCIRLIRKVHGKRRWTPADIELRLN